jgi:pimeloyl-ACP methyl ester carboxylesterase/DNA-binding CsgD family transcriptional regulator
MRPVLTRYARTADARIAYRVVGQGSLDIVLVPGFLSNLDVLWEQPGYARLVKRLCAFARVIAFDRRGTGLSDRGPAHARPDIAAGTDDILAVMDAAGCGRAVLVGESDGAALSILFALQQRHRVRALVLFGGYAHFHTSVMDARRLRAFIAAVDTAWGRGETLALLAPGRAGEPALAEWWARFERLSASPADAVALARMNGSIDLRGQISGVAAPTLLLHRSDDPYANPEGSRALARSITGARLVEMAGREHPLWMGDVDAVADRIEEFLTGARPTPGSERVLAMALVARLCGMSGRAGSPHPHERLTLFQQAVPQVMERYGGSAEWLGADRLAARFDGSARALGAAIALREAAASLGLAMAQGIHAGEVDTALAPISGPTVHIAAHIAASARPPDILLSRLASELVSGSGVWFTEHASLVVESHREPLPLVAVATERHLEPVQRKSRMPDASVLSPREHEVLGLVANGSGNTEIAVQLGLSEHTVKRHVANILLKLELPTRAAAAALLARQPEP